MKRTILLILLLVVSIGSVSVFASNVYKEHDNVTFHESVLYGDRSAADGLNIKLHTYQSSQLFWDTTCKFDNEVAVDTEYNFYPMNHHIDFPESSYGISFMCNNDYAPAYAAYSDSNIHQPGISAAYQELFHSLKPGEEKEKTIFLKDYMDYYEFDISFAFPNCTNHGNTSELLYSDPGAIKADPTLIALNDVKEYFKIPVLDTETHLISVEKHKSGALTSLGGGTSESERFDMESWSVSTDSTCYFTFNPRSTEGNLVDLSELPEGFGIFALPYTRVSDDVKFDFSTVKTDRISMVYTLDPNAKIYSLDIDESKTKLFLYTKEEGQLWMTVIDIATMSTLQKFSLIETTQDSWPSIYNYSCFIAVFDSYKEQITVFALNEKQEYEFQFTCDFQPAENMEYYWYPAELAYDGERLATTGTLRNYSFGNKDYCDFYIMIYDKDGLQYLGRFDNSLDSGLDNDWYDYPCKVDYSYTMDISW